LTGVAGCRLRRADADKQRELSQVGISTIGISELESEQLADSFCGPLTAVAFLRYVGRLL
jgi:hypothetical protein